MSHFTFRSSPAEHKPFKKTVLFVTRKWSPTVGGMETYAQKITSQLDHLTDIEVFALSGCSENTAPGALRLLWFGVLSALRLFFTINPTDVVHVVDMASWPLAYCARLRSRNTQVVLSAHGTDVSFSERPGLLGICYRIYLNFGAFLLKDSVVIANSYCTAEAIKRRGFSNLRVVPLATDMTRSSHQIEPRKYILFVGRLIPLKGCAWFIREVLPLLPESIELHIAGTIKDRNEAKALDNGRVTFLGPLNHAELAIKYASALCVVVPNISLPTREFEGFGLVALEGAASGGIVLAANCGGLSDAVIDQVTGFMLSSGVPGQWADKVMEVYRWTPEQREKFVVEAQPIIASHYSWERVAADTLRCY